MNLAGFLVRDHCQKCKLMWNVATTAGVFKLLISLACVITLIAQFWSGCFRALPHLVLSLYIFPFADPISVENCLRWALMTGLQRFAIYSGDIFSEGWLDSWKVPAMPRHQPSISTRQWLTDKKDKFFFIHLASNNLSPIWRYPKNWSLFTGKKICSMEQRYLSLEQPRPGFDFRVYLCPLEEMSCMRGARTNFPKSAW